MSKFCNNCGAQMEDQATFCPNCGAANNAAPAAPKAPAANKAADVAGEYLGKASAAVNAYIKKAKKNPKILVTPAAAVAAVIVVIIILSLVFQYPGAAGAINRYYDANYEGKSGQIKNLAPEEYWDWVDDKYEIDAKDVKEYYDDEIKEDRVDDLEDEYGKNYKVTFKKDDQDDVKKKDLKKIAEFLKEKYDIKKDDVKAAVKVDGELVIKGSEDDDDDDVEDAYVIKIGGKWYYAYVSIGEESASVQFAIDGLVESAYYESQGNKLD